MSWCMCGGCERCCPGIDREPDEELALVLEGEDGLPLEVPVSVVVSPLCEQCERFYCICDELAEMVEF